MLKSSGKVLAVPIVLIATVFCVFPNNECRRHFASLFWGDTSSNFQAVLAHTNDHGGLAATPDDERNLGVEGGRQRSKKLLEV